MKRTISLLLAATLLMGLLSACQKTSPDALPAQEHTARELADAALSASGFDGEEGSLEYLTAAEGSAEFLTAYLENAYDLQLSWEDAVVIRATGASAFEIAVLRMADSEAAVRANAALMSYIFARQGDFAGYAPAEADMAANGGIMQDGVFAGLFICPNPDGAQAAVEAVLSGEAPSDVSAEPIDDVKVLRDFLVANRGMDGADLEKLDDSDPTALNAYMEDVYGLAPDQWEECAIARGTGDSAFEVAVMCVSNDMQMTSSVRKRLDWYLDSQEKLFQEDSVQWAMLRQAMVIESVCNSMEYSYVVLLVCEDAKETGLAFSDEAKSWGIMWSDRHQMYQDPDSNYSDRCQFTPPNKDDMSIYDTSAIRAAWEKNDPTELSKYDRDIYNQAKKVLKTVLKDGMSDYEKELAIYNWVVQNVDYDWTHQNVIVPTPRESFTPYGGLVKHTAVCLGYATTFQLLMDLAEMECITVPGAAFSSREDHGWNMVRLNDKWYCVDVTWDANMREQLGRGRQEDWEYFNVTSDYMADTDHQWDYINTPEATETDQGRG